MPIVRIVIVEDTTIEASLPTCRTPIGVFSNDAKPSRRSLMATTYIILSRSALPTVVEYTTVEAQISTPIIS